MQELCFGWGSARGAYARIAINDIALAEELGLSWPRDPAGHVYCQVIRDLHFAVPTVVLRGDRWRHLAEMTTTPTEHP